MQAKKRAISEDSQLQMYLPQGAAWYGIHLFNAFDFELKIVKNRHSKNGDYRLRNSRHIITVNRDLNPYAFLITYIHELAHLKANLDFGNRIKPHGKEWKMSFRDLALPILNAEVFPAGLLAILKKHFKNPKASTFSDPALSMELQKYDQPTGNDFTNLDDITAGSIFLLRNRQFKKGIKKRTRYLCKDIMNGKNYLVSGLARVKKV